MIGTANAAITGLLFVGLSIHLREILRHPVFKPRAILVLVVLTAQIIISAIVVTLAIRGAYLWAAVSLIVSVGGGFYVLGAVLVLTLARSVASCWTLLTALETPVV